MNQTFSKYLFQISAIGFIIALVLRLFYPEIANYVFAVCAAGIAITRFNFRYEGSNIRLKRLYRMEVFAAILFIVTSYLMFKARNEWVLTLTIGAFLQLYAAIVIPSINKE